MKEQTQEEKEIIKSDEKRKFNKKILIIPCVLVLLITVILMINFCTQDMRAYSTAKNLMDEKKYEEASINFKELGSYKDSKLLSEECMILFADLYITNAKYADALSVLENMEQDDKVKEEIIKCNLAHVDSLLDEKKYEEAQDILINMENDDKVKERIVRCIYGLAINSMNDSDYETAISFFESIKDYKDSVNKILECKYELGDYYYVVGDYQNSLKYLDGIDYQDSKEIVDKINNAINNKYSLYNFILRYNQSVKGIKEMNDKYTISQLSILGFEENKKKNIVSTKLEEGNASIVLDYNNTGSDGTIISAVYGSNDWSDNTITFVTQMTCFVLAINPDMSLEEASNVTEKMLAREKCRNGKIVYSSIASNDLFMISGTISE